MNSSATVWERRDKYLILSLYVLSFGIISQFLNIAQIGQQIIFLLLLDHYECTEF